MRKKKWLKRCSECGRVIRLTNKSGLCSYHYHIEYRKKNKEKKRRYNKKYYEKNKKR